MTLTDFSDSDLQSLHREARKKLSGLMDRLNSRKDIQDAVERLMMPDDLLTTFWELADAKPETMRAVLQMTVAGLVNMHYLGLTVPELKRRAAAGN